VLRWRRAWETGGAAGLASRGQAARCRLSGDQLAELDRVLDAGPTASGWEDQRWTLARIRDLIMRKFAVQYTIPWTWYLLAAAGGAASWAPAARPSGTTAPSRYGGRRPGRG
jgi:transposase